MPGVRLALRYNTEAQGEQLFVNTSSVSDPDPDSGSSGSGF